MSLRDGPLGDMRPPVAWLAGLATVVALVVAVFLFASDTPQQAEPGPVGAARRAVATALAPVTGALSAPLGWARSGVDGVGAYFLAGSQNLRLRRQLVEAGRWRDEAIALRAENARYRALLGVKTDPPLPMVFARTVLDARGPFNNTRLADAGADRGVIEGNPVLSEHGLVGRVIGVAPGASRIMLLTDVDSRTPVLVARTNGRAILTGDGGPNPQLAYLRTHDALHEGDRILTSGDGGVLPRGLPVGVAVKGLDGLWRVTLDSDAAPIDFVQILLFKDFSQLLTPGAAAPTSLPSTATAAPPPPAAATQAASGAGAGAATTAASAAPRPAP